MSATPAATLPRTERYSARLAAELAKLPSDGARRAFLDIEMAKWEARYNDFQMRVDAGRAVLTGDHPSANDYLLTITEISTRRIRYGTPLSRAGDLISRHEARA